MSYAHMLWRHVNLKWIFILLICWGFLYTVPDAQAAQYKLKIKISGSNLNLPVTPALHGAEIKCWLNADINTGGQVVGEGSFDITFVNGQLAPTAKELVIDTGAKVAKSYWCRVNKFLARNPSRNPLYSQITPHLSPAAVLELKGNL